MRRLIFTVMVAASACSHAANWSRIAINNVGTVEEVTTDVDLTSIRFRDGYRQAWSRFSYTTEQIDPLNPGGKRYLTLMYLGLYDCKNAEAARIALAVYTDRFGGGDLIRRIDLSRAEGIAGLRAVLPGTIADEMKNAVCTGRIAAT